MAKTERSTTVTETLRTPRYGILFFKDSKKYHVGVRLYASRVTLAPTLLDDGHTHYEYRIVTTCVTEEFEMTIDLRGEDSRYLFALVEDDNWQSAVQRALHLALAKSDGGEIELPTLTARALAAICSASNSDLNKQANGVA